MTRLIKALVAFALVGAVAVPVLADSHGEKAIAARKAVMTLRSWELGTLGAMAKGTIEYNAEAASAAAANLAAIANMKNTGMWPQGTDSTAMAGKTRAKAEIWTTYPAITENGKAFVEAANALAAVAGNGLDALKGAIGPVGEACGGCHKKFREEQ